MTMQTRVFIVHMLPARASRLFARASVAGMMTEGYVWIVTDNVGISLDVLPQHTIETMQGVVKGVRFSDIGFQKPEDVNKSLIDTLLPSPVGPELLSAILETDFDGLAGRFTLVDRHMQVPVYEVVNVIGDQAKGIGFWSPASGLSRILNSSTSHGQTKFSIGAGEIQWPGGSKIVPKGWDLPVNGKIFRIGVPIRHDFKLFVSVDTIPGTNTVSVSGYSIDVFEAAVKKLPYALRYNYIPFDCANSYDNLVARVYLKEIDAAVGDVTIIANRATDVDFTMPYTESGVSMLVLSKNNDKLSMWIFLQPLTNDLWIATTVFIFFTGLVVWMSEFPSNDEFRGSRLRQFSTVFYFIFSTLTFSHDQIIRRLLSKVLAVIWCFVVLTLVQSYTASLSSLITAKRLQPSVTDPSQLLRNGDYVRYQNGSFVLAKLKHLKFDERKIKGVFPRGSPLVPDLSRAILDLREGHEGFAIQQKWFGDATPSLDFDYGGRDTDSARLSLKSFAGLFIINGFVLVIVLVALIKIIWAYRNHSHVINGKTVGDEEPEPLQDDMATDSVPAESLQVETIGDIGHQQLQNGLAIDSVPAESLEVETRTS
ncbi:hypothetical protein GQ55_4G310900 [Panicum hallii var. hallii]|uniref:Ionotropic glutamate receptor C-terminal domain-containing protein n=1 Tax=Panicum hallii var. hallii TaxID=1504633 RepID=A0A2T7E1X6_9POAL|nr:hypothetical protein GQ55_4G310900 [Panicum hallii var. hallii]